MSIDLDFKIDNNKTTCRFCKNKAVKGITKKIPNNYIVYYCGQHEKEAFEANEKQLTDFNEMESKRIENQKKQQLQKELKEASEKTKDE